VLEIHIKIGAGWVMLGIAALTLWLTLEVLEVLL
jgi:hypothetical protein